MLADNDTRTNESTPTPPASADGLRIALAHDYLSERGGAERVVVSLLRAFPDAPLYTSVYDTDRYPDLSHVDVRASVLNHVGLFRRRHRMALPLLPFAYGRLGIDADAVICSSSGWAHGVRTEAPKIVYCHNPARWIYQRSEYGQNRRRYRLAGSLMDPYLRRWDRRAADGCDRYLANSRVVAERIVRAYGVEAEVVPPPTTLDVRGDRAPVEGIEPGYVMVVGRLHGYKNVAQVVDAFRLLPSARLVVVGDGPLRHKMQADAPSNVVFVGRVEDDELRWLYANSAALVSASFEDFGLTPVEAALYGKPSALLRYGGFLDTTIEGVTGLFFEEPEPWSIAQGVRTLLQESWNATAIAVTAERFSEAGFAKRLHDIVAETVGARPTSLSPAA